MLPMLDVSSHLQSIDRHGGSGCGIRKPCGLLKTGCRLMVSSQRLGYESVETTAVYYQAQQKRR